MAKKSHPGQLALQASFVTSWKASCVAGYIMLGRGGGIPSESLA